MNNKIILFALILLSGIYISYGQVYQIDNYNGQTVTTCKGVFESSGGDPNICNGYNNGETSTVTFCSGTPGKPIRVSFLTWDLETNFDFLYVYDGTSTAAPLIGTITGNGDNNTTPLFFTSSGECLTFKFVSDNSVDGCGWEAIIGCSPVSCNGNLPAGDACSSAPQICNLNGYCGNTSGWYTPDHMSIGTTGSSLFCGSIENNSWISFVAANTTASFSLTSANCIYTTSGIQAMILRSTNCNTFQAGSNCVSQSSGSGTFTITSNVALVPGNTYYLMIDGYAGNICDYTITALNGVALLSLSSSAQGDKICAGSTAVITAHGGPPGTTYSWTPTGTIIGSSTDSAITVNPTVTTTYTLVATVPNGCGTQTITYTLTVGQKKTTNTSATICEGKSVSVGNHTYTQTGNYTDTLRTSLGCDSVVHLNLTVIKKSTTNISRSICQGQTITVGNHTYSQTGNYTDTLRNSAGCDSVVNLALTVNPKKTTSISRNICEGQTVTVGTHTYSQTGTYHDTLRTSLGCDSVVNLSLTVNPKKSTAVSSSLCQGQTITIGTHTYSQTGTYHDTLRSSAGCDSVITLTLTVTPRIINNISRTICEGQSVTVGTHTYSQQGNYSDTLHLTSGCDSVVNLNLTVNPKKSTNLNRTICEGQSVTVGTHTYTQQGNYTDSLLSSKGCDSIVHLSLFVNPKKTSSISRTICEGQNVVVGTHTYTQQGNYTDTLHSSAGCDSVVHLALTVNPKKSTNISRTICEGQNVVIGTHTYTQTGNYTDTLASSVSCDSVVHLALTVNPKKTTNIATTICTGQSYTIGTQTFNTTGNYSVTLLTSLRCDSVVNLDLVVTDSIVVNISSTICNGKSVTIGNQIFNSTGNYTVYLQAAAGCDSTVNLNLTVLDSVVTNLSPTICEGNSVTVGNQTFDQTGNYTVTLTSSKSCDSIVHVNLTVNPVKSTDIKQTLCEGQTITVGTQIFSETGLYTIPLQTSLSCDSIVHLDLTVNPTKTTELSKTICEGESVTVGNQDFDSSGNYTITLKSSLSCDSVVHLNLTVNPIAITEISSTICNGESVTIGNQTFNETGNYSVTLHTSLGCDSTVNLSLTVNDTKRSFIETTFCEGESITIGNQTFTETGQYDVTLHSSQGCDSIVHLDLTVIPKPVIDATSDKTSAKDGDPIQLNVSTSETLSYSWTPVSQVSDPAIQNPIGTLNAPTWFVVVATNSGTSCKTTDSIFVDLEIPACNKDNVFVPNAFSPNGDGINDIFLVRSNILKSMTLLVYNRWGNTVYEGKDLTGGWDGVYKGQPAEPGVYGYYFTGECIGGEKITLKGSITLLR